MGPTLPAEDAGEWPVLEEATWGPHPHCLPFRQTTPRLGEGGVEKWRHCGLWLLAPAGLWAVPSLAPSHLMAPALPGGL